MTNAKRKLSSRIMIYALVIMLAVAFTITNQDRVHADDEKLEMGNATQLTLNSAFWGTAVTKSSTDFSQTLSFTTTGNDSFYNIYLTNSTFEDDLTLYLYDDSGARVGYGYSVGNHTKDYITGKLEPNKKYFILIYAYGYDSKNGDYKLEVDEVKDDVADNPNNAKALDLDKVFNGKLQTGYDEDWFKVTANRSGKYTVRLTNTTSNTSNDQVYFQCFDADVVSEYDYGWTYARETREHEVKLKKGEIYYIRVYYDDSSNADPRSYKLKVISPKVAKPAKVTLSTVKAGKKSLTAKFKKAKNATKYRVAVKAKGTSKWKYYTSKKLTKKIAKLKSGKKYSVKVQGVRVVSGKSYYGKWSKTKTVKVK